MAKPFDVTTKDMVEAGPLDWLKLFGLPGTRAEVVDADLSTITTEADRLIRVTSPKKYLSHIEFEAGKHGRDTPRRLLSYNSAADLRYGLPVESAVVLLKKAADSPALSGELTRIGASGNTIVHFNYRVVRIWKLDTDALLGGGLATLPLAPLTVKRGQVRDVLKTLQARAEEAPPDVERKILAATYILLGLNYSPDEAQQMIERFTRMRESSTFQAILAEGREEGLTEGQRKALLMVGERLFSKPTDAVRQQIASLNDTEVLETLLGRVTEVKSWNELLS